MLDLVIIKHLSVAIMTTIMHEKETDNKHKISNPCLRKQVILWLRGSVSSEVMVL